MIKKKFRIDEKVMVVIFMFIFATISLGNTNINTINDDYLKKIKIADWNFDGNNLDSTKMSSPFLIGKTKYFSNKYLLVEEEYRSKESLYGDLNNDLFDYNQFSISITFNMFSYDARRTILVGGERYRWIGISTSSDKLEIRLNNGNIKFLTQQSITLNQWHNIIVSVNQKEKNISICYDGIFLNDIKLPDDFIFDTVKNKVNHQKHFTFQDYGYGGIFHGYFDNITVYSASLKKHEMEYIYTKENIDSEGYDRNGYDKLGYDKLGFNNKGFNKETGTKFGIDGYDKNGYDKSGFNKSGFNNEGYNKSGYNSNGYNKLGYDKNGYNSDGYNKEGRNANGYDRNGYDKNGFNSSGWSANLINKTTKTKYDSSGYDYYGYDKQGYNTSGWNANGINKYTGTKYNKNNKDKYGNYNPSKIDLSYKIKNTANYGGRNTYIYIYSYGLEKDIESYYYYEDNTWWIYVGSRGYTYNESGSKYLMDFKNGKSHNVSGLDSAIDKAIKLYIESQY